jgi:hypothetical protein
MSQELRVRIDDEAHAMLKAMCAEQELRLPQVLSALIRQAQTASGEAETKLDVVLLQLQRVQEMLEALLAAQAPPQAGAEKAPLPIASYEDLYGPIVSQPPPTEEQIPEAFRPTPRRGFLNRLLYKEEA